MTRGGGRAVVGAAFALAVAACEPPPSPGAAPTGSLGRASLFEQSWHWHDERGDEVLLSRWQGAPIYATAIFTSCTSRCPMTIEKLRALDAALVRKGIHAQFLLVTLDPATDDPARLMRFKGTRQLPASWHLLRGDLEATRAFGRLLGIHAAYDDGHIEHDVRIAMFDATGRMVHNFAGWNFDEDAATEPR